ncbi:NAD(P)H-binding protein [Nocardia sp. NPDC051321]|uniref:NAD(P)H-binding protein n=1 Tax=Nocardia sp. NPDC051321 TaxID=3364323 RepID=UPI0037BDCA01
MTTTLVLGATGKTGRRVASLLRDAGHEIRAASRSGDVRFDWSDESTWDHVLIGADAVYLVCADDNIDPVPRFMQRVTHHEVRRVVLLSGRGAEKVDDLRYLTTERAVKESGVSWTILRPASFYQNFDEGFFRDAVLSGSLILPVGEGKESFIDAWDIAEVAVAALTDSRHAGHTYELTGPRAYSISEAFSLISAAAGRDITFTDIAPAEFNAGLIASGISEANVQTLDRYLGLVREGATEPVTDAVEHVLGKPARDFESYVATTTWNPTTQQPVDSVTSAG